MAGDGSYSGWHGAHAGIGTLPILYFGTEEQKQQYLPKLATAEMLARLLPDRAARRLRRAGRHDPRRPQPDGKHYILNGQKMWITNGGAADLFTVFAKVGGEKFTAFLVERAFPGVTTGAEEKKMGIKGSSTTAVYFDNVQVPVENVLGEIGRGHIIAFNILNIGRLKLGPGTVGGSKNVLAVSPQVRQGAQGVRHDHRAIRHDPAQAGRDGDPHLRRRVHDLSRGGPDRSAARGLLLGRSPTPPQTMLKAVEEFAAECSIIKVYASEVLDYVVDEGVQIHGGYGYHQDYAVERAYRDSRINRIFEGTNEINRLLITGMLLKRAARGQLGLVQAAQGVLAEILGGPRLRDEPSTAHSPKRPGSCINAKKIALLLMGVAYQKYLARAGKAAGSAGRHHRRDHGRLRHGIGAAAHAETGGIRQGRQCRGYDRGVGARRHGPHRSHARTVLAACSEGDTLRTNLAVLRRFTKYEPVDAIALRRQIAQRLLDAERYIV